MDSLDHPASLNITFCRIQKKLDYTIIHIHFNSEVKKLIKRNNFVSSIEFEKKIKMADSKKTEFFKIANSQYFFVKISWIGPWVSRIE